MSDSEHKKPNHLHEAVERRMVREDTWRTQGERSPAKNLALIGAIGWLVVAPILVGIIIGHWLDAHFQKGITFTAGLVILGAVIGGYLAWQRINKE